MRWGPSTAAPPSPLSPTTKAGLTTIGAWSGSLQRAHLPLLHPPPRGTPYDRRAGLLRLHLPLLLPQKRRADQPRRRHAVNGCIDCFSTIIKSLGGRQRFRSSYAALYLAGQTVEDFRNTLEDLGHLQGATSTFCDNATAVGIATRTTASRKDRRRST